MLSIINTAMSVICGACVFAIPVLLIIFFVRWMMKKKKKWIWLSALFCAVMLMVSALIGSQANLYSMSSEERAAYYEKIEQEQKQREEAKKKKEEEKLAAEKETATTKRKTETTTKNKTTSTTATTTTTTEITTASTAPTTTTKTTTTATTSKKNYAMITQFKDLGFTDAEAENMKEIFATVGITKINNIQGFGSASIDGLKVFKCGIYDSLIEKGGPTLQFTIDKRQLCFISLNGFYNTIFQKYQSITLYDIWDENGEIIPNAVGYKAVIDYENKEIKKYE